MKYTPYYITVFLLICFVSFQYFSREKDRSSYRFAFYNVENLFDPYDDSEKNDEAFTPDGQYNWTEYRWKEKTTKIAKVIRSLGHWNGITAIGLCEIENRLVLDELVKHPIIADLKYDIIHAESPDRRGIDVALLYQSSTFKPLYQEFMAVHKADDPDFRTRDILYVKALLADLDTIHVFVNHWPSRYGGQVKSEPNRIRAAQTLRDKTDSISIAVVNPNILIMGDFNDEWEDISLRKTLAADKAEAETDFINLMSMLSPNKGTHRYQGHWGYLDQFIISRGLWEQKQKTGIVDQRAYVYEEPFLLEKDEKFAGEKPFRTFIGFRYHNGYSDHLPVYLDLQIDN